jgi:hypothetical protein
MGDSSHPVRRVSMAPLIPLHKGAPSYLSLGHSSRPGEGKPKCKRILNQSQHLSVTETNITNLTTALPTSSQLRSRARLLPSTITRQKIFTITRGDK